MEFEIEIEITGNSTNGLIRETQGRTEEVRTRTDGDPLGSVMRCLVPELLHRASYVAAKHAVIGLTKQAEWSMHRML